MNLFIKRMSLLSLALVGSIAWSCAQATERNWSYTYNGLGLIETANGPRTDVQDVTTYSYDGQGRLTSVTNALGQITTLSNFDNYGNPQSVAYANGVQASLTYRPQGWLASASNAGSTTSFEHDNGPVI